MIGIETDAAMFHGVDLGWMQTQWRDCQDKGKQLGIFRDMVGRKVPEQEILDAVGDPSYCGPVESPKRAYRPYTPEEDGRIVLLAEEGRTNNEIAEEMGRNIFSVTNRIKILRGRGVEVRRGAKKPAPAPEPETAPEIAPEPVTQITAADPGAGQAAPDIRAEIDELLRAEEDLTAALAAVRTRKKELRESLAEMMDMLGGDGDA